MSVSVAPDSRNREAAAFPGRKFLSTASLRAALVFMVVAIFVAGLYPFEFNPKNQVEWLHDPSGLHFYGYGEVMGPLPMHRPERAADGGMAADVSIELWISSEDAHRPKLTNIVSIYRFPAQPFAVEQWHTVLMLEGFFLDSDGFPVYRHVGIDQILLSGARRFVTITSDRSGTSVYLEGVLQQRYTDMPLAIQNFGGTLLLGQAGGGRQQWNGKILGLALYPRALRADEVAQHYSAWRQGTIETLSREEPNAAVYSFNERSGTRIHDHQRGGEDLVIPNPFRALYPVVLEMPTRHDLSNLQDVSVNILGFIPLGVLSTLYLRQTRRWSRIWIVFTVVSIGAVMSLTVELLQVYLPARDSSLLDLVNNISGTLLGSVASLLGFRWL